jgi:hypothetical protein
LGPHAGAGETCAIAFISSTIGSHSPEIEG